MVQRPWMASVAGESRNLEVTSKESQAWHGVPPKLVGESVFFWEKRAFPSLLVFLAVLHKTPWKRKSFLFATVMSFVFRGSRGDLESGFVDFIPERRNVRFHGNGRPVNANPLAFLVTVLLLFMILNSHQMSPHFLLWLGMGVFLMATGLRMYAMCQQLHVQAHAHAAAAAAAAGGLLGHTELRLRMPPSITFATRGRLQGLRLQLALLDREFDDLDYDALRALDADNPPGVSSLSDSEINALPLHKYKSQSHQGASSSQVNNENGSASHQMSSGGSNEKKNEAFSLDTTKGRDEDLTCSVCLEQVIDGELVRSLPCIHKFHASCIDQWLRQQATCPVCKFRLGSGWQAGSSSSTAAYMV